MCRTNLNILGSRTVSHFLCNSVAPMVKLARYLVSAPVLQVFQRRAKPEAFDEWVTLYLEDFDDTVAHPQLFPCEILQSIFFRVVHGSEDIDPTEKILIRTTVLSCAQVCRSWRSAALGDSTLWVHALDFQHMPISRLQHLLSLSAPHRFDLEHRDAPFCVHRKRDLRVLEMLQHHYSRVREWNIKYCMGHRVEYDVRWLFSGHPFKSQLRTFRWTGQIPNIGVGLRRLRIPVLMLDKLAIHDVNFMPYLYMQHVAKPSQLTELSVCNLARGARLHPLQLLDTLRRTPYLRSLTLHDAIAHEAHQHPLPFLDYAIDLFNLEKVSLADSWTMDAFVGLFKNINTPAACDFELILPAQPPNCSTGVHIFPWGDFFRERIAGLLKFFALQNSFQVPALELNINPRVEYPIILGTVRSADKSGHTQTSTDLVNDPTFPMITIKLRTLAEEELHQAVVHTMPLLEHVSNFRIILNDVPSILGPAPRLSFGVIWPMLVGMRNVTTLTMDESAITSLLPLLYTFLPIVIGDLQTSITTHPNGTTIHSETLDMVVRRDRSYFPASLPALGAQILVDFLKGKCRFSHLAQDGSGDELPTLPNLSRIVPLEGADLGPEKPASVILLQYMQWRWTTGCPVDVLSSDL